MSLTANELLLLQARKQVRDEGILTVDLMVELQLHGFNPEHVIALSLLDEVEQPLEEAYHRAYTNPDLDSKRILSLVHSDEVVADFGPINGGYGVHEVPAPVQTM